jgi:hypothetical protein
MLRPNKHMNPDRSILSLAGALLSHMRTVRMETYSGLVDHAKGQFSGADAIFIPTMALLFLLGLVSYHRKSDSFEYIGK